jgi:hypothetical protein
VHAVIAKQTATSFDVRSAFVMSHWHDGLARSPKARIPAPTGTGMGRVRVRQTRPGPKPVPVVRVRVFCGYGYGSMKIDPRVTRALHYLHPHPPSEEDSLFSTYLHPPMLPPDDNGHMQYANEGMYANTSDHYDTAMHSY